MGAQSGGVEMSSADSTASSSSDGLKYFWIAVRLAGGMLGVLTLLSIAAVGLGVEYKVFFQEFLNRLKDWIELAPLLDPIEKYVVYPTLDWFRSFGWTIPELADHWRSIFTLMWLLQLTVARRWASGFGAIGYAAWAFLCAVATGVATGTAPLGSWAVGLWPTVGLLFFFGSIELVRDGRGWWQILLAALVAAGTVFYGFSTSPADFGVLVPSLGLSYWIFAVGFFGLLFLASGLLSGGSWRDRLSATDTDAGLDIIGVMGAALFIGWLMQA